MSRGHRVVGILAAGAILWVILLWTVCCESYRQILYSIPSYSLVVFGSYALYSIGRDLSVLKDFPEEHQKVVKEIGEAQEYFKKNKVL